MLKILQARLQQYVNCELPDIQADFRKGRETEIKLPTSTGLSKKQESFRKTSISALLITPKPLCGSPQTGKFLKRWNTRPPDLPPEKICMQVRKQQLELDMEKQTGSKSGKKCVKAVCCHLAYLTYMQRTS